MYSCSYTQHRESQTMSWASLPQLQGQLWHGETEAGQWEEDAAASSRVVLGSQESHCPTVRLKAESRNVTTYRNILFVHISQIASNSGCNITGLAGKTQLSSSNSSGQAGAVCICFAPMIKGRALRIACSREKNQQLNVRPFSPRPKQKSLRKRPSKDCFNKGSKAPQGLLSVQEEPAQPWPLLAFLGPTTGAAGREWFGICPWDAALLVPTPKLQAMG